MAALWKAFEMKLFEAWEDVEEQRSSEELAEHTRVERLLMGM